MRGRVSVSRRKKRGVKEGLLPVFKNIKKGGFSTGALTLCNII